MKLCIDHKLELWKRGYGSVETLHAAIPTAYQRKDCDVCNGTWKANWEASQIEIKRLDSEGNNK